MSSSHSQQKILNIFKEHINSILSKHFNYQNSVYKFNELLNSNKKIDKKFSDRLTLYFIKKMDNFITIQKKISEEISLLEKNLKQLDNDYILNINKMVKNLKVYSSDQKNIYKELQNNYPDNNTIKELNNNLVNYYNNSKDLIKIIKFIHDMKYNNKNNNVIYNSLCVSIDKKNFPNQNSSINININNNTASPLQNSNNSIFNSLTNFKFIMNNRSKSLKWLKKKNLLHITENKFRNKTPIHLKIEKFMKNKTQFENNSTPCLVVKSNLLNSSDNIREINIFILADKIIEFFDAMKILQENIIKKGNDIKKLKIKFELKKKNLIDTVTMIKKLNPENINNIKNSSVIFPNNILPQSNEMKTSIKELINKINELIQEKNSDKDFIQKSNENIYSKILELFKIKNISNLDMGCINSITQKLNEINDILNKNDNIKNDEINIVTGNNNNLLSLLDDSNNEESKREFKNNEEYKKLISLIEKIKKQIEEKLGLLKKITNELNILKNEYEEEKNKTSNDDINYDINNDINNDIHFGNHDINNIDDYEEFI